MSDPLRTDPARAGEPAPDASREAKIEQLLLAGLDHYLAARYEHAVNIWTRALFLDRSHARARAYIERARSALAERQRESEEMLQDGVAAFDRGEAEEARRLLQAAISQGAPSDEAVAVLDRLNRLDYRAAAIEVRPAGKDPARGRPHLEVPSVSPQTGRVVLTTLALVIAVAAAFAAGTFRSAWGPLGDRPFAVTPAVPGRAPGDAPSLPRQGDTALTRARSLVSSGRLRDALVVLELVRSTDVQKPQAESLRAEIQRQLLGLAGTPRRTVVPLLGDAWEP